MLIKRALRAGSALYCLLLVAATGSANVHAHTVSAVRRVRTDLGVSFGPPSGFRESRSTATAYRAERPDGARILIHRVLTDETATSLPGGASALAFPKLHNGVTGRILEQDPNGYTVDGAPTSLVTVEHWEGSDLRQTCQILALMHGRLFRFEFSAPTVVYRADFPAFSDLMDSIRWLTPEEISATARPARKSVTQPAEIRFRQVLIPRPGLPAQKLWVYTPAKASPGGRPCIVIAPGASHLYYGADLTAADKKEQIAYAQAGFVVVAYAVDGIMKNDGSDDDEYNAALAFKEARGGLANARIAIDYALNVIHADPLRLYVAGRRSAGTLALQVAENDPRVAGCVAFTPCVDVEAGLAQAMPVLDGDIPGFRSYVQKYSPKNRVQELRCPVFLFHPSGDRRYAPQDTQAFAARAKTFNPDVTFIASRADEATLPEGVPQAVAWMKRVSARR
jgi:dienelactone hydrolase